MKCLKGGGGTTVEARHSSKDFNNGRSTEWHPSVKFSSLGRVCERDKEKLMCDHYLRIVWVDVCIVEVPIHELSHEHFKLLGVLWEGVAVAGELLRRLLEIQAKELKVCLSLNNRDERCEEYMKRKCTSGMRMRP